MPKRSERIYAEGYDASSLMSLALGTLEKELALEAMQPSDTISKELYIEQLKKTAWNDWVHCVNLLDKAKEMDLHPKLEELRINMLQYSNDRLQQALLFIKAAEETPEKYSIPLDSVQKKIDLIIKKIQNANEQKNKL